MKEHHYEVRIKWTGNKGTGTSAYTDYDRNHVISIKGKPDISGSSDPAFRGDPQKYNPEDLLVTSLSSCHMLWYLHLCAVNKVVITEYTDNAKGKMKEDKDGSGHFSEVTLHPEVTVSEPGMMEKAEALHEEAHRMCFIARSVNFPVHHRPVVKALTS